MDLNRRTVFAGAAGVALTASSASAVEIPAVGGGQAPPLHLALVNAPSRATQDLSGQWAYSIDPYRSGLYGFHGEPAGASQVRYAEADVDAQTRAHPNELFEYDMARAPQVTLPGAWLAAEPTLRRYVGLMWYQRTFVVHRNPRERVFLRFAAANYFTRVYLNGMPIGEHEGGFTPFAFEITTLLRDGENRVTLGVDSEPNASTVPPPVTDWENYGGVTRDIHLVVTPRTFIDDAWIRLTAAGAIAATLRLDGPDMAHREVRVRIAALGFSLTGRTGVDGVWHGEAAAPHALQRWSPDSPTLYGVSFESGGDVLGDRVGFRTIAVDGPRILLNGAPIFLRGIALHEEEFGPNPARRITPELARALLMEAKQGLGANFVRLAHYPHNEITTRLADELGLLVWSEIPVYWRVDFTNTATRATARRMLAENIVRDRNRASIMFWSIANETPVTDARNAFLAQLAADVRALDSTRLVAAALLTERRDVGEHMEISIADPLVAHLDVMAVNTYYGWYTEDPLSAIPNTVWRSAHDKPFLFSEFGADALAGFHDPDLKRKFSEEFQADFYRATLAMCDRIPGLSGFSPWILKDFRSPRRQHPVYQQGWNRKGLVSETGVRKQAFAVLADYYRRKAG